MNQQAGPGGGGGGHNSVFSGGSCRNKLPLTMQKFQYNKKLSNILVMDTSPLWNPKEQVRIMRLSSLISFYSRQS